MDDLRRELTSLLNKHSAENGSDTPDYVLSVFLLKCLRAFDCAVKMRGNATPIDPVTQSTEGDGK